MSPPSARPHWLVTIMTWLAPAVAFGSLVAAVAAVTKPVILDVSLMVPVAGFAFAITVASIYLVRSVRAGHASPDSTSSDSVWHAVVNIAALVLSGVVVGLLYMRMMIVDHDNPAQQYTYFHNVVYEVTSDTPTPVTVVHGFYDPRLRRQTADGIDTVTPWQQPATLTSDAWRATLTVRIGDQGGRVTCKIIVDGALVSVDHASGPHGSAHCSAIHA